jgi:hypothetical protein
MARAVLALPNFMEPSIVIALGEMGRTKKLLKEECINKFRRLATLR